MIELLTVLVLLALGVVALCASDLGALPSAAERATLPADGGEDFNRLIHASSPYLLQHASNPVDWYEWGDEAFAAAAAQDKPIFLSIGYSTCHWCHVMARESFEDEKVAAVLQEHFIAVKLDREERPDIDHVYMTFVQATTGHGGWPMSVFLTPDRKPFYGGTYFPKTQFIALLEGIAKAWDERREEVDRSGERLVGELQRIAGAGGEAPAERDAEVVEAMVIAFERQFDDEYGGFGPAPKFPRPATFLALQPYARANPDQRGQRAGHLVERTLREMAAGGMYDHVGGGFHRYSVDKYWHVPHFEKMLYDQGQLAVAYIEAWQHTGEDDYAAVAADICAYVLRDLRHAGGAFFSAEDADSARPDNPGEHAEGAFYVWTAEDLRALLGERFQVFAASYGVGEAGNIRPESDPHGELEGVNQLYLAADAAAVATDHGLEVDAVLRIRDQARELLLAARNQRPRPHLDDKILTAWNGLMLSGLARTGAALDRPELVDAAVAAADFLRAELYDHQAGILYRVWRDGRRGDTRGFADDHAFLVQGLLDLYQATMDARHLLWARELQALMDRRFLDAGNGGWFNTEADQPDVLLRAKEDYDGAEPAASSVAARNCLRLGALFGDAELHQRGEQALRAAGILERAPHAAPAMVRALQRRLAPEHSLVIVGERDDERTRALLRELHRRFHPFTSALLLDAAHRDILSAGRELRSTMTAREGKPTAYFCEGRTCQAPTTDPAELGRQLERAGGP